MRDGKGLTQSCFPHKETEALGSDMPRSHVMKVRVGNRSPKSGALAIQLHRPLHSSPVAVVINYH